MNIKPLLVSLACTVSLSTSVVAEDFEAGPIWNNDDAKAKCPAVCQKNEGRIWNGNWVTTRWNVMSVCNCVFPLNEKEEKVVEPQPDKPADPPIVVEPKPRPIMPEPKPDAVVQPKPVQPAVMPPAPTEEHKGQDDPCKLTCRRRLGVEYNGESVYNHFKKKDVCRCFKDPERLRARGK